jgi:hypothetical protein
MIRRMLEDPEFLIAIVVAHYHHVQHLSSGGGAEVLPVPSGDGFEAENSINFLSQTILFHNLLSFTL